ncbi:hypothetical protein EVAR_72534_1, partial [Eumeta japonica]
TPCLGVSASSLSALKPSRVPVPNKWFEAGKSYKLTSPHTTMLQLNRHLNHGWQSFALGITLGLPTPMTETLLGLYAPKAERQGVAPHQDQTCTREHMVRILRHWNTISAIVAPSHKYGADILGVIPIGHNPIAQHMLEELSEWHRVPGQL